MSNIFLFITFFGMYFLPIEKMKNEKSIIDRHLGGIDYNNIQWYSKLKGKKNPVQVKNRYIYEQEVEYNLGILKEDEKMVFALKEYYGDYGSFTTAEKYYFDTTGILFATEYICAHFQNGCNKNENSIHQIITFFEGKKILSKEEKMVKESGKKLEISRCENPFYEEIPVIYSCEDFFDKYDINDK